MAKQDPCAVCADTFVVELSTNPSVNKKTCMSCGYDNSQLAQNS